MKQKGFTLIALIILIAVLVGGGIYIVGKTSLKESIENKYIQNVSQENHIEETSGSSEADISPGDMVSVIGQGLDTPWAIAFLPDGNILVTERKGTVRLVKSGQLQSNPAAVIPDVREVGEGGLMGVTIDPDFAINNQVYFYYTYAESGNNTLNRVVKMTYKDENLSNEKIIVDAIPGASNHDGGRIKFGPDKYLYITTGDAQEPSLAQDKNSLAGKILRVDSEGNAAPGNPFGNRIYSYGHRNPQGITWAQNGQLWATEHGPSGIETGNDEVNKIEPGKNYGWPEIRGTQTKSGMETPLTESGRGTAWAPAGMAYFGGRFFFGGLRGSALYEVDSSGKNLKTHLKGEYGRIREVIAGPEGMLYITTSNLDGRGTPKQGDDKILRIDTSQL